MRATDLLTAEHRVIEQVLDCLERMANHCERAGRLDGRPAREAVTFFRTFADNCHHGKEEHQLFPMLESRGFEIDAGPTAVMRREHVEGRELVGRIEASIDGASAGEAEAVKGFVAWARTYVHLLREHIGKEDRCLFPMANQLLGETDQRELLSRFRRDSPDSELHEGQLRVADALAERFGVPRARRKPSENN